MSTTTPQEAPKKRGNPNFGKVEQVVQHNEQVQANDMDYVLSELRALREENEALKASVDPQKYAMATSTVNKDKRTQVRLRMVDEQPIIAWSKLIKNEVRYLRGEEIVDQRTVVTFIDGKQEERTYDDVFNNTNRTDWLPVNGITHKEGKTFYIVEYLGDEHTIESTFINA